MTVFSQNRFSGKYKLLGTTECNESFTFSEKEFYSFAQCDIVPLVGYGTYKYQKLRRRIILHYHNYPNKEYISTTSATYSKSNDSKNKITIEVLDDKSTHNNIPYGCIISLGSTKKYYKFENGFIEIELEEKEQIEIEINEVGFYPITIYPEHLDSTDIFIKVHLSEYKVHYRENETDTLFVRRVKKDSFRVKFRKYGSLYKYAIEEPDRDK